MFCSTLKGPKLPNQPRRNPETQRQHKRKNIFWSVRHKILAAGETRAYLLNAIATGVSTGLYHWNKVNVLILLSFPSYWQSRVGERCGRGTWDWRIPPPGRYCTYTQGCRKVPHISIIFPTKSWFSPPKFPPSSSLDILPSSLNVIGKMILLPLSFFSTIYSSQKPWNLLLPLQNFKIWYSSPRED